MLTLVIFVKLAQVWFSYAYWALYSQSGRVQLWQIGVSYGVDVLQQWILYAGILLIAKGWTITRIRLAKLEQRSLLSTIY
jgi:hypothetical protein